MSIVDETSDGVKCEEFAEVIKIDGRKVRQHVEEVVRQSVEETLNGLLEAEADELCAQGCRKKYYWSYGFIPARTGNSRRSLGHFVFSAVHPRVYGELARSLASYS